MYDFVWPKSIAAAASAAANDNDNDNNDASDAILALFRKISPSEDAYEDFEDRYRRDPFELMQERIDIGGPFAVLYWCLEKRTWKPAIVRYIYI